MRTHSRGKKGKRKPTQPFTIAQRRKRVGREDEEEKRGQSGPPVEEIHKGIRRIDAKAVP